MEPKRIPTRVETYFLNLTIEEKCVIIKLGYSGTLKGGI